MDTNRDDVKDCGSALPVFPSGQRQRAGRITAA